MDLEPPLLLEGLQPPRPGGDGFLLFLTEARGDSFESHVIPAKAGIHRTGVPACAVTTTFVTFSPMRGFERLSQ